MTPQEELAALKELEELQALEAPPTTTLGKLEKAGKERIALQENTPKILKKVWDDASRGLGLSVMGLGGLIRAPFNEGKFDRRGVDAVMADIPVPENESIGQTYLRKGIEGAGSALMLPVGPIAPLLTGGFGSGIAGEAASQWVADGKAGPTGNWLIPLIASMLGGAGAGWLAGPKQSVAKADIKKAVDGLSPEDWTKASQLTDDFAATGSKSATQAEAFPGNSELMDLARRARAAETPGPNPLKARTENRQEDLVDLSKRIAAAISGRDVEPGVVANQAAKAGDEIISQAERARATQYGLDAATGPKLSTKALEAFRQYMLKEAGTKANKAERQAYEKMADIFGNQKEGWVQNSVDVKEALKLFKEQAAEFGDAAKTAAQKKVWADAYKNAVDFVNDIHGDKGFPLAEKNFIEASRNVVDPLKSGSIGRLAPPSFGPDTVTPIGRLTGILNEFQTPQAQDDFLQSLGTQAGQAGPSPLINDIAKVVTQKKLAAGPTNPARSVAGNPGSMADEQFSALMKSAGADMPAQSQNLRVARALQDFQGPAGISGPPEMRPLQALLRPFRTLDMMLTFKGEQKIAQEVAEILAAPSQENLQRLREISQFNPDVRKWVTANAAFIPGFAQVPTRMETEK